ncbi:DUF2865 domain-containing protein [Methylocapsa acidiphila]|uniref:DUF2865 domain-containing protein n=1 Tax=Methylocapsa acidiphila TaxID=133552 RepID=UPI00042642EA|nr:DUF2865 domain-containing protein [Methylocapsa acidiphila]
MINLPEVRRAAAKSAGRRPAGFWIALAAVLFGHGEALAQPIDCTRLSAEIAAFDQTHPARPSRSAGASPKLKADLDRTIAYARSLGCNRPQVIFGPPLPAPCPGLNAQIGQMQATIAQIQAAQSAPSPEKQALIARYNAYCRGGAQAAAQPQAQPRNFFEQLFGGALLPNRPPTQVPEPFDEQPLPGEEQTAHGGSQAVCVRSCDGGYFPLPYSARHPADELSNLCQALCPNADVSVYTRAPYSEISTAVSIDNGSAYSDLPNALKFQRKFEPSCTCKPPDESWAQALAGAERLIGPDHRGDVIVTEEKSAELSAPTAEGKKRSKQGPAPAPASTNDPDKTAPAGAAPDKDQDQFQVVVGPDGIRRRVRRVGPTL